MKTEHYTDKSQWPAGEWHSEPDRAQWIDEASGFDCLIRRGGMGVWCGYVGVPESHPLFGMDYHDLPPLDVHGGVTFTDTCTDDAAEHGICHTGDVANERVWWVGFDCGHGGDVCPGYYRLPGMLQSTCQPEYRNMQYALNETLKLAEQLARAKETQDS